MHEICFGVFDVRCTTLRIPSFLMYSAMGHDKGKSCENVLKCVAPFFQCLVGLSCFYVGSEFCPNVFVKSATGDASQ